MAYPACPPPPGYRFLQPQDLAVGKDVLYISRDPNTPHIHTMILDITIVGNKIKLKHKSEAPMNRVFVTDEAAVGALPVPGAAPRVPGPEGAGAPCPPVGEGGGGSPGAEATGPNGSAGAASATLGEAASPGEAVADADTDKFLRNEVVCWMSSLEAGGSSLPEALDAALAAIEKTPEGLVQAFKDKVPWQPCVNFQAVPKCSKTGTLHISMLS